VLLIFFTSSKHKFFAKGRTEKHCTCERCDAEYSYVMERDAVGEDTSLFSWDERSAFRKAEADAHKKLDKLLAEEEDEAPCPECGWVQGHMVRAVRNQSYRGLRSLARGGLFFAVGGLILGIAFPLLVLVFGHPDNPKNGENAVSMGVVGLIIMLIGLTPASFAWSLRKVLQSWYDPNRNLRRTV
jgi:hypothetical protein